MLPWEATALTVPVRPPGAPEREGGHGGVRPCYGPFASDRPARTENGNRSCKCERIADLRLLGLMSAVF